MRHARNGKNRGKVRDDAMFNSVGSPCDGIITDMEVEGGRWLCSGEVWWCGGEDQGVKEWTSTT